MAVNALYEIYEDRLDEARWLLDADPRFEKLLEKVKREWEAFAH